MKKLPAISRADLLRLLLASPELDENAAAVLGYERKPGSKSPRPKLQPPEQPHGEADSIPDVHPLPSTPEPELIFLVERPRLKFLMPTQAETLKTELPPRDPGNPISDAELAVPWEERGLPLRPLVPWARLAPFLKSRLGIRIPGTKLDHRKLLRLASNGLPLTELPRLPRMAWAAEAVILWDHTPEMYPFTQDVKALYQRLRRERGSQGLKVIILKNVPRSSDITGFPDGTPILAISAMGQFEQNPAIQAAWLTFARRLESRNHVLHSLNPCPRHRWQSSLANLWTTAVWDRGQRLPRSASIRRTGLQARPEGEQRPDGDWRPVLRQLLAYRNPPGSARPRQPDRATSAP